MCGIVISRESTERCIDMLRKMKHRALPGTNYYSTEKRGPWYMGHNRLPIIDTNVYQNQPMTKEHITLVFNGEFYNYKDFGAHYTSDTEALLDLLIAEGPSGVTGVDGMYAIVYYDDRDGTLHVITDHLAKKPLYMDTRNGEIASEIKAFTRLNRLNARFLANVAHFGYNPDHETVFADIIQIPPNHHVVIQPDGNFSAYGNLVPMSPLPVDVGEKIVQAVKNRLISDVPISFLLSGGLDSSIVCEIASWMIPNGMNTFYIDNDEAMYSKIMADHINANHVALDIDKQCDIEEVLYYNESPVDLGSVVPQYLLCREVKNRGHRVVITGDGADELFGGYTRMSKFIHPVADSQYHDVFSELPYYHCPRLDKMSMAHTVELRSPFLSREVIRAALAVPYEQRIGKQILKDIFQQDLPEGILSRSKVPLRVNDMKVDRETFRFKRIEQFLEIHEKGRFQ